MKKQIRKVLFVSALAACLLGLGVLFAPVSKTTPAPESNALLKFATRRHVWGFGADGFYLTNAAYALRVHFVGAKRVTPHSNAATASTRHAAPPLERVTYPNLWDGITLMYEAVNDGLARSAYRVEPGADANAIRLQYNAPVTLNADGTLTTTFANGQITESAPIAWQEIDGARVEVPVTFRIVDSQAAIRHSLSAISHPPTEIAFALGAYNRTRPLWIDPTLSWNTFLGSDAFDLGYGIAVDDGGNVYVVGESPVSWGSPVRAYSGDTDAFVAMLDTDGGLTWNTFLGSSEMESGRGIAMDAFGNVYVTGSSRATWGLPVRAHSGVGSDAYAAKLDSGGALVWNTFLGGSAWDLGLGIAGDTGGDLYVVGNSSGTWGSPVRAHSGENDAFVAKLDTDGGLTWNTFLGSANSDNGTRVAADTSLNVYVVGGSGGSWGCAIDCTVNAYSGDLDAFVAKLDSAGALIWNTFLGSEQTDDGYGIAVDGDGDVYVSGESDATWGSPVRAYSGMRDAFVAQLNSSGARVWNLFLGGAEDDGFPDITVGGSEYAYVAGESHASWGSPVRAYSGENDAFVAKLHDPSCVTAPLKPTLKSPKKDASVTSTRPTLKWNAANCADSYKVTVKDAATGKKVDSKTVGTALEYKTKTLTRNKTYKWFVQACNAFGCAKSATWKFFVKP